MPALNAPSSTQTTVDLTGALGKQIVCDPLSAPTGGPLAARQANRADPNYNWAVAGSNKVAYILDDDNYSCGAAVLGIGFGRIPSFDAPVKQNQHYLEYGGTVDVSTNLEIAFVPGFMTYSEFSALPRATLMYIGGGYSETDAAGASHTLPWDLQDDAYGFIGGGAIRDEEFTPVVAGKHATPNLLLIALEAPLAADASFDFFGADAFNFTGGDLPINGAGSLTVMGVVTSPPVPGPAYPPL